MPRFDQQRIHYVTNRTWKLHSAQSKAPNKKAEIYGNKWWVGGGSGVARI